MQEGARRVTSSWVAPWSVMKYALALDQGTTSSRAILFAHDGGIVGVAQHEFRQIYPDTGWVEHDPFDILTSQSTAAIEVLAKASLLPRDVAALGIANQRETTSRAHRRAFEHRRTRDRLLQQVRSDWNCIRMYLAGLAVNFWSSTDEIARLRGPDTIFEPAAARKDIEARQAKWRDAVKRTAGWNSRASGGYPGKSEDPLTR